MAELLDGWIQCVLQAVDPWMSSKDIDRGSTWFSEITDQLKDTKIGIICLSKDNLNKPWILFEAGALSKGLSSSRVCTFLIDIEPADVSNPLAQFNHTMPDRAGVFELVRTINKTLGETTLKEKILEQVFDTYWPQFEEGFRLALENHPVGEHAPERSKDSVLMEILRTTRSLDRRVREVEREVSNERSRPDFLGESGGPFGSAGLRVTVREFMKQGVPPTDIIDLLGGKYPREKIRRAIELFANGDDEFQSGHSGDS